MDKSKEEILISWTTLWRIFFMLILITALFLARNVLLILFLAIVVSAAFDGPVTFFEKKGIPRVLGTLVIFILLLATLALILYTVIPIGITEFKGFLDNLSSIHLPVFGSIDSSFWIQRLGQNLQDLTDSLFSGNVSLLDFVVQLFGNIILVITSIVLSFYLTVSRSGVEKFLKTVLPLPYEDYVVGFYHRVRRKLGLWLQGQLVLMLIVGAIVFLGLWILGVKYKLILAVLAGLLEIVPVAGPIFSGTLGFLFAFSDSWLLAVYTAILFFVVQQLENHLLVPLVMRKTVGINPVVVVLALLAGSEIAGIIGIILAVPAAVVFQELFEDWEERKLRVKSNRLEI